MERDSKGPRSAKKLIGNKIAGTDFVSERIVPGRSHPMSNSGLSELPCGSNSPARQMLISGKFKSEFFFSPHN